TEAFNAGIRVSPGARAPQLVKGAGNSDAVDVGGGNGPVLVVKNGALLGAKGIARVGPETLVVVVEIASSASVTGLVDLARGVGPVGDGGSGKMRVGAVALEIVLESVDHLDGGIPGVGDRKQRAAIAKARAADHAIRVGFCDALTNGVVTEIGPVIFTIFGRG